MILPDCCFLLGHYVDLVRQQRTQIQHFSNLLVCDGYFGVQTFVEPVFQMDICLISCLRSDAALYYTPVNAGSKSNSFSGSQSNLRA